MVEVFALLKGKRRATAEEPGFPCMSRSSAHVSRTHLLTAHWNCRDAASQTVRKANSLRPAFAPPTTPATSLFAAQSSPPVSYELLWECNRFGATCCATAAKVARFLHLQTDRGGGVVSSARHLTRWVDKFSLPSHTLKEQSRRKTVAQSHGATVAVMRRSSGQPGRQRSIPECDVQLGIDTSPTWIPRVEDACLWRPIAAGRLVVGQP